ncbi:hypothetical protein PPTG_07408 [Phytophthora nicotianae INRA-310]|uniref:Uncharacterized protein n=2 Tax=Phytophthora nicotianae TaxID=4792 RepID=W2QQ59_PHYN3|nr:hypothetical protein PPTG_07408 [Phytophthora nicotianae INRA-310]ETN15248.1 hypothetical protein PPTG_07408 [Phytophthora nicotianae INRA-310]
MNEDRLSISRPSSDSTALLLVDTRASQSLEPIRLPTKLRDRIDRAQRRANAVKDGVSIFTKDSKDSAISVSAATVGRRTATAPTPETTTASLFGDFVDPHRVSTASGGMDDKMHLPNVVLSHKMRDFEARANAGGSVALFSADPADRSLQSLSLEDRERVMLVMQAKIRQIASDVDASFARITKALDANGIFDSAANIQRAQTLCLVDLQRRCKLDKLRDEAMREVLNLPTSTPSNQKNPVNASRKLSQLLRPTTRATSAEMVAAVTSTKRRKRKPVRVSKLPALSKTDGSLNKNNQASSPQSHQDDRTSVGVSRMLTRRGGLAPPVSASQIAVREEVSFTTGVPINKNANDWELYTQHSHVAQILQLLAKGESSNTKGSGAFNPNSAEADMDHSRVLDPVDEWTQRSPSYQSVGARAAEAVRKCGERQRWDTLVHFRSNFSRLGVSAALRQRLEAQHSTWKKGQDTIRSDNGEESADYGRGSSNQQQRDKEIYAELQAHIRERLIASERRTRTAAATVRVGRNSSKLRLPQTAPAKIIAASSSTISLPVGEVSALQGDQLQPLQDDVPSPTLGISVSEPVLSTSTSDLPSSSSQKHSRFGSRVRMSVLELKMMRDPSLLMSRHGRRKESLIGAPHTQLGSKAIGRHSEARIAYRRDTAQTWAWHLPPDTNPDSVVDTIVEDDERDEDRFDEEGYDQNDEDNSEEGEEREDGTEYAEDDTESVDSSRTGFSARSSMSMSSVKRSTNNGSRKHGKNKRPPTVQRRASRGPGGRSAANTLTGHALSLHARLEVIWRVLQFPYSNKLTMLERLSTLQDADAFVSVLEHWERVTPLVAIRQRMKLALSGYAERGDLRPNEWVTPSEIALVSALPQPPEPNSDALPPRKTSLGEVETISPSAFIEWVRTHFDTVTLQIQKLANDLKTHTGEELQFQGHPYPRRR